MTVLPITLTIAAACGFMSLWLAFRVIVLRRREKVSIGHAGNDTLHARIRAHSNFAEYAPLFVILLGLLELAVGSQSCLWFAGAGFVLARIAHAIGMDRPAPNAFRIGGVIGTLLLLGGLACYAIAVAYVDAQPAPAVSG